jgi:hypothetical protein
MSNRPSVTLILPPEFLAMCKRHNVPPSTVLKGFIADLCGLATREYSSNGSDERMHARAYYERCGYRLMNQWLQEQKKS